MYNAHRGMMPQHQVPPNARLTELLEQIRSEFENQARSLGSNEQERDHFMHNQMQEMTEVRRKVFELEQNHAEIKQTYERRIAELQRELDMRGPPAHHAPQHSGGSQQAAPPSIGHGPKDLFGQIMAGAQQGPSALGPPPQEPQQPQGLPAHLTSGAGLNTGPQQPQHAPAYGGYNQPGPTLNGYQHQAPQQPPSPGAAKRAARGPPGAATPQTHNQPYPGSPRSHMPTPPPGSHRQQSSLPPPQTIQHNPQIPNVGNSLSDLSVDDLPPHLKKVGTEKPNDDWWAIFNPRVQRVLDVELVQTLQHTSVVCCVRFSHDGRYIATGCNRAAQIFDVNSGQLVAHLEDETPDRESDLYIRSVCFSPDGKYLATGAEDQVIRVWDIAAKKIKVSFTGHEQDIYSLDFSRNGRHIASGSGDKTVRLWDMDTGECPLTLAIEDGVTTVALSGDGRLVAAGSLDRSVRVWDCETGARLELLDGTEGHGDSVYSVAFSPTDRELVSGSLDRTIKMWSLTPQAPADKNGANGSSSGSALKGGQGKCIRTFEGHADFVLSVALTPDGQWVLSGSKDRGVQFWNPRTGEAQLHLQGHRNSVISVAPSPTGGLFATGSGDQKARIWSYKPYQG